MTETWKPIQDFDGYEVSDLGHVRCVVVSKGRKTGRNFKPNTSRAGYRQVRIRKDGRTFVLMVHRLVMAAFVGPRPEGMQIRHLDGNKDNNALANLRYGTAKENAADKIRHGRSSRGEANVHSKLTEEEALECIRLLDDGASVTAISMLLDAPRNVVFKIKYGKTWTWLRESANNRRMDRATQ